MEEIYGSVVIPVCDAEAVLERCLRAAVAALPSDFEIIVVDDASSDRSPEIAARFPCRLLRLDVRRGAAVARNFGAGKARGSVLVFIDADILVKPETFERIRSVMSTRPDIDAVVGLYEPAHEDPGIFTQYKNLYTFYEYSRAPERIWWFFTSIGAVRATAFSAAGGFDPSLSSASGLDDIEFGQRLFSLGHSILLDKGLAVFHLKRFSWATFLENEWVRSTAWMEYVLSGRRSGRGGGRRAPRQAQAPLPFLGGVLSLSTGMLSALLALKDPRFGAVAVALCAVWIASSSRFLLTLARFLPRRKWLSAALVLAVDHAVMGLGGLAGFLRCLRSRRPPARALSHDR